MTANGENGVENETLEAIAQGAAKPQSCLKKQRVTVTFSPGHREFLEEIEQRLQNSPRAEKPVTPTTIIATVCEVAQGALINSGRFEPAVIKTADTLLDEGKAALDALVSQASQEAASGSETPVDGSAEGVAQDVASGLKASVDGSAEGAAQPSDVGVQTRRITAKFDGKCRSCRTRFDAGVDVGQMPDKTYQGLDCCDVGRALAATIPA